MRRFTAALVALPLVAALPVLAQSAGLSALKPGLWNVRFRDGTPQRRICVKTGRELVQLRHRGASCGRYVTENGARSVTVQYSCGGDGHGRSSFRVEDAQLVQIESQGVSNGRPFQFSAEARRVGNCS